jgi:O-succinylbenzoate synthase
MRQAQVYRWQIPMDAGVVLRERRLKTRDGLFIRLQDGEREGWGKFRLPGFSLETLDEAQAALLAWASAWREGEEGALPTPPSAAFGELRAGGAVRRAAAGGGLSRGAALHRRSGRAVRQAGAMPGEKVAKVKVGLYEAVRDGMVVNLLLEAIPDLRCVWTLTAPGRRSKRSSLRNTSIRSTAAASPFLKNRVKPATIRALLPGNGIAIAWDESLREADFPFAEPGCVRW